VPVRPPVVLIVGDHEESLAICALGLLAMGFNPVTAENAAQAFARACTIHPDAIVADATLADSSGLELTRRLRDDVRTRASAIIVLCGSTSYSLERAAREAGCDRLVLKPCMPDALSVEIRDVLALRRGV
jgi:CheY-like chemotaxis protein